MKKENNLKKNIGNIIIFLSELIIGIILLIKPLGFTKAIIITIGIILTILGIIRIIKYFTTDSIIAIKEYPLSIGLIFLVSGLFCIFKSNWFILTFPILTILYGIVILITGLKKVEWTFNALRLKRKYWFVPGISAILSIIFAIIIINNPFQTTKILWQFTGIILIIEALIDITAITLDIKNK